VLGDMDVIVDHLVGAGPHISKMLLIGLTITEIALEDNIGFFSFGFGFSGRRNVSLRRYENGMLSDCSLLPCGFLLLKIPPCVDLELLVFETQKICKGVRVLESLFFFTVDDKENVILLFDDGTFTPNLMNDYLIYEIHRTTPQSAKSV
jgi:hypothetical protein